MTVIRLNGYKMQMEALKIFLLITKARHGQCKIFGKQKKTKENTKEVLIILRTKNRVFQFFISMQTCTHTQRTLSFK